MPRCGGGANSLRSAVLAFTAASMINAEPLLARWLGGADGAATVARWALVALAIVGVLGAAHWSTRRRAAANGD